MTDTLDSNFLTNIFADQVAFNQQLLPAPPHHMSEMEKVSWTKEYLLHLMSEMDEVLRELNWKVHRKEKLQIIPSNLLEELIDMWKYWLSIVVLWGFTPAQVLEEYQRKSTVVVMRQEQTEALKHTGKKIAVVDVDGVLADYRTAFMAAAADLLSRPGLDLKATTDYDVGRDAGIALRDRMRVKHHLRETGAHRVMPVWDGAPRFMQWLERQGYFTLVLSARPHSTYKRLFSDTMTWLLTNGMPFSALIFTEEKHEYVDHLMMYDSKSIAFAVEDELAQANNIAELGIPVYLLTRPYNSGTTHDHVVRITMLQDIITRRELYGT